MLDEDRSDVRFKKTNASLVFQCAIVRRLIGAVNARRGCRQANRDKDRQPVIGWNSQY
jgi:hypothetical protein